ncbi:MAG: UDP-2,3-diacylglucosamine diphosphatase, partial [Pseudomonadota bacterium]|nr:UDP-2,3-diacylglucosamine diphosphatase [Pseudomonadota bacterium]
HAATAYAERKGYDGVICGHIHVPAERHFNNTHYLNTGDWQDSCSAIIEHENGDWELLDVPSWLNSQASIKQLKPRVA